MDLFDLKNLIEEHGEAWQVWMNKNDKRFDRLEEFQRDMEKESTARNRPPLGASDAPAGTQIEWVDVKTGRRIPVLEHKQRLVALADAHAKAPSLGRTLRGLVLGNRAPDGKELEEERKALGIAPDPAGGYTVQGVLAAEWIDRLRAQMVLSEAGARTVPMETGEVTIARVENDPTVSWHAENAQVTDSAPTFGAVTLTARTVVCLVKLSVELSQDSANIEQILQSVIVNAMARAIDSAGLNGVTVDAGAAPIGILNLAGRNVVSSVGTPTNFDFIVDGVYELLADNVRLQDVGALIAHPKVWKKLRKLKTGLTSDQTTLVAPPEVASLPKLWTTASPEGTAVIADWRDLLFGVRQEIAVQVLRQTFMASNLQVAIVAFARCNFAAARKTSFCTLEGITGL